MLNYNANLKDKARQLRKNLTDSEKALWSRLRNRQLLDIRGQGDIVLESLPKGAELLVVPVGVNGDLFDQFVKTGNILMTAAAPAHC